MANKVSIKHLQIDKSQSRILLVIIAATAITIFSLVATKAMVSKGLYQRRALHARREVVSQLKNNYSSAQSLFNQYKVFAQQDPNILGGSSNGSGNLDGNNPRIVLDSLPSNYDAPALATSIEKVLTIQNVTIGSLTVTDDPVNNSDTPQAEPQAKPITFSFSGSTNYAGAMGLMQKFEQSIRPFDVTKLQISGTDNNLQITADMTTYFQPAKSLDLTPTKVVQ